VHGFSSCFVPGIRRVRLSELAAFRLDKTLLLIYVAEYTHTHTHTHTHTYPHTHTYAQSLMHAFSRQEQRKNGFPKESGNALRALPSESLSAAHQVQYLWRRTDVAHNGAACSAAAWGSYAAAQDRLPPSLRNLPCSVEAWSTPRGPRG
jgi:hypothetical protein